MNYKDAGRPKETILLREEVHQASKRFPELREVVNPLIDAYQRATGDAKLADLLRKRLSETRKSPPKDRPDPGGMLNQLGLSLLQQKKWIKAEPLLRECLAICE